MGKKQAWVSFRLTFGRFLIFITPCYKNPATLERLTEGAFRKLYSGTRGTEKERFAHVVAKLEDSLPVGHRHQIKKPGFRTALVKIMEDEHWYTTAELFAEEKKGRAK